MKSWLLLALLFGVGTGCNEKSDSTTTAEDSPPTVSSAAQPDATDSASSVDVVEAAPLPSPANEVLPSPNVVVDLTAPLGTYRDVLGANRAPRGADSQALGANTYNVAELYKALGISTVRALDSQFDVCSVYNDDTIINAADNSTLTNCTNAQGTHVIWSANNSGANVNNSASYGFTTVDRNLDAIATAGASLYLRLGENNNGPNDTTDFANWTAVAKNLYRHVSGVSGGFGTAPSHANSPLYIEIFNEPDASFWMGTKSNFYTLYNTVWDAIDAIAPSNVKIGGSGFATTFKTHVGQSANVASSFVTSVTAARLDFLSGHVYGGCENATVAEMADQLSYYRTYMNSSGLSDKPLIISEWNIGLNCSTDDPFHSARAQSFNGIIMGLMQDPSLNVEKAMIYDGFGIMSFMTMDPADVGAVSIHPGAWAFKAHSQLMGGTVVSTQVCDAAGTCQGGMAAAASTLQATSVLQGSEARIALANDEATAKTVVVQLDHWAGAAAPAATVQSYPSSVRTVSPTLASSIYTVSAAQASALMSSAVESATVPVAISGASLSISVAVPANAVVLLSVQ